MKLLLLLSVVIALVLFVDSCVFSDKPEGQSFSDSNHEQFQLHQQMEKETKTLNTTRILRPYIKEKRDKFERDYQSCAGGRLISGQCLSFSWQYLSYNDATAKCAEDGGRLASLADPAAVLQYVKETYGDEIFYAGGSDIEEEGTWKWSDGSLMDMGSVPWSASEPNDYGGDEDCLELRGNHGINDVPCSHKYKFICEKVGCKGTVINGQYLTFTCEKLNWHVAGTKCAAASPGGQLAALNDPSAVLQYLKDNFAGHEFWVGASDIQNQGNWVWTSGVPVGSIDWAPGEPNNRGDGQDCLVGNHKGYYDDGSCWHPKYYICESGPSILPGEDKCKDAEVMLDIENKCKKLLENFCSHEHMPSWMCESYEENCVAMLCTMPYSSSTCKTRGSAGAWAAGVGGTVVGGLTLKAVTNARKIYKYAKAAIHSLNWFRTPGFTFEEFLVLAEDVGPEALLLL